MRWPLDDATGPQGLNTKKLYSLCSEKFADVVATQALPVLELFCVEDEFYHCYYFSTRQSILDYLYRLRIFFWQKTTPWLGPRGSPMRDLVNRALCDVLDHHSRVNGGPRDQQLFAIFLFQLLFQDQAGKLVTPGVYGVDHLCINLRLFLRRFDILEVTALYWDKLYFDGLELLPALLKHTPHLKFIQINYIYQDETLKALRLFCPNIEEVKLFKPSLDVENVEDSLSGLFFCSLNFRQVLGVAVKGESICLSFPNLRSVSFFGGDDEKGRQLKNIVLLLQHFYRKLKIKWCFSIKDESVMHSILENGIFCPSFVKEEENRFSWDGFAFKMEDFDDSEAEFHDEENVSLFLKANYIHVVYDQHQAQEHYNVVEELLRKFDCQVLKVSYMPQSINLLSVAFHQIGPFLQELYLDGPLFNLQDGFALYIILFSCVNLSILAIQLDLTYDPKWGDYLRPLPKLKVLSLKVVQHPMWLNYPNEASKQFKDKYMMCQGLPAYFFKFEPLMLRYLTVLCNRIQRYDNSLHTLSSYHNMQPSYRVPILYHYICQILGDEELRSAIFGEGPLKYENLTTDHDTLGYGALECISNSDRIGTSVCRFKSPLFSFYGDPKYNYRLKDTGFLSYMPTSHAGIRDDLFEYVVHSNMDSVSRRMSASYPGDGQFHYTVYSNIPYNIKRCIAENSTHQDKENELRQWRLDMNFRAPSSLLCSLIAASPNLEVLEIPDLRAPDALWLYLRRSLFDNLSKVHTLHLSAQFNRQLFVTVQRLPSLKTLRVSPENGVDNFLRFKENFRYTNLIVEAGESNVYPGSNPLA